MEVKNLTIPIYLNQQIVFDLLAIIEDGFSQLREVKSTSSDSNTNTSAVGGKIGANSVLSFLGISLTGSLSGNKKVDSQKATSEEKVHTPASLFSKMRSFLLEHDSLHIINSDSIKNGEIRTGDFVEFEGILKKNPMVQTMEILVKVIETFFSFTGQPNTNKNNKHNRNEINENKIILDQMKSVLNDLTQSNAIDFIVDIKGEPNVQAVLSTQIESFKDQNAFELIDGQFKVLGKVIKIVDSKDNINLLRKTSFGIFDTKMLNDLTVQFEGLKEHGINIPRLITDVKGPAIQILPIAIFA